MLEGINKIYLNLSELLLHIDKDTDRYVNNRYSIKLSYLSLKKNLTNIKRKRKLLRGNDSEESILSLNSIQHLNERLWSFRNLTVHKETQK